MYTCLDMELPASEFSNTTSLLSLKRLAKIYWTWLLVEACFPSHLYRLKAKFTFWEEHKMHIFLGAVSGSCRQALKLSAHTSVQAVSLKVAGLVNEMNDAAVLGERFSKCDSYQRYSFVHTQPNITFFTDITLTRLI